MTMLRTGNKDKFLLKESTYNSRNGDKILADTRNSSFTVNLPSSPVPGAFVEIADAYGTFATNNLIVLSNKNILNVQTQFNIDLNRSCVTFIYVNEIIGWTISF